MWQVCVLTVSLLGDPPYLQCRYRESSSIIPGIALLHAHVTDCSATPNLNMNLTCTMNAHIIDGVWGGMLYTVLQRFLDKWICT